MKTLLFLLLFSPVVFAQRYQPENITALLGAFSDEVKLVQQSLEQPQTVVVNGVSFMTGRIGSQRVVVVATGIGKVNAAMTTAIALTHFRPRRVLFTGIAGGTNPDLQPGDIVIARQTAHHDYQSVNSEQKTIRQTRNPILQQLNPAYFPADSALLQEASCVAGAMVFESIPITKRPPSVVVGTVVTGDQFISSAEKVLQLRADFGADATEMEGAAVAQVCYQQQVPCLVIRSLSDRADDNAGRDMRTFYEIAARNSAKLVLALVRALE